MVFLSWNARGLCKAEKRRGLKALIKVNKAKMVLVQETKKASLSRFFAQSIWVGSEFEFAGVDAIDSAGGLLCVWERNFFKLQNVKCSRHFILLSGKILPDFDCVIVNIYAPNKVLKRKKLWDSLLKIRREFDYPWCLGGDLNEIRSMGKGKGDLGGIRE